jgi:hypothetical protein
MMVPVPQTGVDNQVTKQPPAPSRHTTGSPPAGEHEVSEIPEGPGLTDQSAIPKASTRETWMTAPVDASSS